MYRRIVWQFALPVLGSGLVLRGQGVLSHCASKIRRRMLKAMLANVIGERYFRLGALEADGADKQTF